MSEEVKVLATKASDLSLIFEFSMLERTGFYCLSLTSIYPPWCAHFTHTHFIYLSCKWIYHDICSSLLSLPLRVPNSWERITSWVNGIHSVLVESALTPDRITKGRSYFLRSNFGNRILTHKGRKQFQSYSCSKILQFLNRTKWSLKLLLLSYKTLEIDMFIFPMSRVQEAWLSIILQKPLLRPP